MNKKLIFSLIVVLVFILGIIVGLGVNDENRIKLKKLNPIKKSCIYEGKSYKSDEGFPAGDGCNSCSCYDGEVSCTMMACSGVDYNEE